MPILSRASTTSNIQTSVIRRVVNPQLTNTSRPQQLQVEDMMFHVNKTKSKLTFLTINTHPPKTFKKFQKLQNKNTQFPKTIYRGTFFKKTTPTSKNLKFRNHSDRTLTILRSNKYRSLSISLFRNKK